jgi:flagellar assembly protein FliH
MAKIIKPSERPADRCAPFERSALDAYLIDGMLDGGVEDEFRGSHAPHVMAQIERAVREGFEAGMRQGVEAARTEFKSAVGEAQEALRSAAQAIVQARETYLASMEPEVVRLAHAIASRILRREARVDVELMRTTIRAALEQLAERERVRLHMNPADLEALAQREIDIPREFGTFEHIEIIADETVGSGGCAVETESVSVDARIETQLQRILDGLLE